MANIGYARVSTGDQTLDLQRDALRAAGCIDIYEEYASGARATRPELAACLRACRDGDTLVIWKLDRLGRSTKHLVEIADDLAQRGIGLKTLTGFDIDTNTAHGKLLLHVFAALAEYERTLIQERIMAGIAAARGRGHKGGRRPKLSPEQRRHAVLMAESKIPITEIAKTLQFSRPYRTDAAITPHLPYLIGRQCFCVPLCTAVVSYMSWRYFPLLQAPVVFPVHRGKMAPQTGHFPDILPVPNTQREIRGACSAFK